jgi:aminoglycoside/choline kinase family phosphotransferase
MSDSAEWRSVIDLIIPHPSAPRVLLLAESDRWYLPRVSIDNFWAVDVGQICHELRRRLGIATTVLRLASKWSDDEQRQVVMTYVLENRAPSWQPPAHGCWAGRAELDELAQPEQRAVLDAYLAEAEHGVLPELRMPWCRAGWLDAATAWIAAQLADHGTPLVGEVEQVSNWSLSCVLRAHTATGAVYFKAAATLPLFVNEPVIMAELARRYPDHIPAPIRLDPQRRWMLLPDLGRPLGYDASLAARQELLHSLATLQRESATAVDYLLKLGCHDRRLERLSAQAAALAANVVALGGLTDAERAQFHEALPRLQAMCAALAACGIPHTLVHGDLHLHNVAVNAGRSQFFDWTDACVSHPFFDLISVFDDEDRTRQAQLRGGYLSQWSDCALLERLLEAWTLAQPLSDLHQAISYQHILVGLEPAAQVELGDSVPYYVRKVLYALGLRP